MARDLPILLLAFVGGAAFALLVGAKNLGTALGAGQVVFVGALVYVLMRN
jgi:hypothetical protein